MTLRTFFALVFCCNAAAFSQVQISGDIIDSENRTPIAYANIGIKEKNIGTTSLKDGSFALTIPPEYLGDTLTFSMIGYHELSVPIRSLSAGTKMTIRLIEKVTALDEFVVLGAKPIQRKYGIKKRGLVHFTDGIFKVNDSFEIGQVIKLGNDEAKITSVNLHINASRADSASFRINFYRYDVTTNKPTSKLIEKIIFQRHAIREGWLRFDIDRYNVLLSGNVFVSIEFIPEHKEGLRQIYYEVKIGGASKSFYRSTSLGRWNRPPHHYCLFVTALVDKNAPDDSEEEAEIVPTVVLKADNVKEPYSIFVRLPRGYHSTSKAYPVVYHLDGNAFFDPVTSFVSRFKKNNKGALDPIVVGIGYENAYVMDSLRNRDYTFPVALASDSFHTSGGGDRFYQFIKMKLNPYVEANYRIDTASRTIMGHSLGGYFVLYALLKDISGIPLFNNYVAASPSISYYDDYIVKQFERVQERIDDKAKFNLYISIGDTELQDDPDHSFEAFEKILLKLSRVDVKTKVYDGLDHMGTAIPTFEDGMEFALKR